MGIYNLRQVILVSSRYKGKDNVMALAWHSPASFNPDDVEKGYDRSVRNFIKCHS